MLSDVTICITSFLRPGYLIQAVSAVDRNLPECKLLVVDDSDTAQDWMAGNLHGGSYIHLPFDSGLPAKRNAGVAACKTKYWLCGCDDFDFSTPEARQGIEHMVNVLDAYPTVDVASGRVHNAPYEGFLEYKPGEYVKETRLVPNGELFQTCDLTVNYFLGRTDKLVPWQEECKIGGEHGLWFLRMKEAGRKTVWVPGVNINTFNVPSGADPRYGSYRARAVSLGHAKMKEILGIKHYIGFGGDKS